MTFLQMIFLPNKWGLCVFVSHVWCAWVVKSFLKSSKEGPDTALLRMGNGCFLDTGKSCWGQMCLLGGQDHLRELAVLPALWGTLTTEGSWLVFDTATGHNIWSGQHLWLPRGANLTPQDRSWQPFGVHYIIFHTGFPFSKAVAWRQGLLAARLLPHQWVGWAGRLVCLEGVLAIPVSPS